MTRVFLDANVFIYTIGRPHPLKQPSSQVIDLVAKHPTKFVTGAEVFQEVLHRYVALRLWTGAVPEYFRDFLRLMVGRIEPLLVEDVSSAAQLADELGSLSARDLVHLAVMRRIGCTTIITADSGFDGIDGITRLDPMRVDEWRSLVTDAANP